MATSILFLSCGFFPVLLGIGFIFKPKLMVRMEKAYTRQTQKLQRRLFKAHRATGLFFVLIGTVLTLSLFHPIWIYHCFLITRVIAGMIFPSLFETTNAASVVQTHWI
ncbi:MAG: hypothetical protein HY539_00575 [Deltaproteobacteria bacterium]|nr:hypothetical protein [Deltaproteobacteria bacterium]